MRVVILLESMPLVWTSLAAWTSVAALITNYGEAINQQRHTQFHIACAFL
jgi:hypothetical protein